jgi:hypothetical protein
MVKPKTPHRVVPLADSWFMQYARMHRSFARMKSEFSSMEEYEDAVYHFFQDAWHLKDWLKNDPKISAAVKSRIEGDLGAQPSLCAAADIANGSKHVELSNSRVAAKISGRRVKLYIGEICRVKHERRIEIGSSGSSITADNLAKNVVKEWNVLLKRYGLA